MLSLVSILPTVTGVVTVPVTVYSSPIVVIVGVTVGWAGTTIVAVLVVQFPVFNLSQIWYTIV